MRNALLAGLCLAALACSPAAAQTTRTTTPTNASGAEAVRRTRSSPVTARPGGDSAVVIGDTIPLDPAVPNENKAGGPRVIVITTAPPNTPAPPVTQTAEPRSQAPAAPK